MELIPIQETLEENASILGDATYQEVLSMTIEFYKRVGFHPPWIGYTAHHNNNLVGTAGFKGKPVGGQVEIAYGTFEQYQKQGIGTQICKLLVDLSLKKDPSIIITARTLPEKNYSTRILEKNNFEWMGIVDDPDDGPV